MTPRDLATNPPEKTQHPQLTDEFLRIIRQQFYADATAKQFMQERNILLQAITWPAKWFAQRTVSLTEARYRQIIMDRIQEIKRHGNTAKIKRFSAYLLHVLQEHFKHHGEAYYEEAKSIERQTADALLGLRKSPKVQPDQTVEILAQVHAALTTRSRTQKKVAKSAPEQQTLF